jgi:hypothetical protein
MPSAELQKIRELAEQGTFRGVTLRLPSGIDRKKGYEAARAALEVFEAADVALPGLVVLATEELERGGSGIDEGTLAVILKIFARPLEAIRQAVERQRGASGGRR